MNFAQRTTRTVTESRSTNRNSSFTLNDLLSMARRGRVEGHRLIRVPGRGYVVRRRINGVAGLGLALAAGGIGAMLADFTLAGCGRVAVIVGTILWCYQRLQASNTASNAQYQLGKDLGYEEGWQDRDQMGSPKLIDINSRRGEAGAEPAMSPAGHVGDRG